MSIVRDINIEYPRFNAKLIVLAVAWTRQEVIKILPIAGAKPNIRAVQTKMD